MTAGQRLGHTAQVASNRREPWWAIQDRDDRAQCALSLCRLLHDASGAEEAEEEAIGVYEGELDEAEDSTEKTSVTNAVQWLVDSFVSKIISQRIRVQFQTEKGNWEEREKAKEMSRAVEGIFDESGLYGQEGIEICRDGCVSPSGGAVKISADYAGERVLLERVAASRLYTDPRDARMGKPRTLVYGDDFAPEVLAARFPEFEEELFELGQTEGATAKRSDLVITGTGGLYGGSAMVVSTAPRIQVYEIWHLPSGSVDPGDDREWSERASHDGRHMILCGDLQSNKTGSILPLIDESWALDVFPVCVFRPYRRVRGWMGHSMVERLTNSQRMVDKMQLRVDALLQMYSRTLLYINRLAEVNVNALTNDWSRILEGNGPPGEAFALIAPTVVPPELLRRIDQIVDWMKESRGTTELQMRGEKPPGVESGVALRHISDEGTVRHTDIYRAFEEFHLQMSRVTVEMCRLLASKVPGFSVFWGSDSDLRRIEWRKINLRNDRFRLRRWPTNLLPQTPGAKLEKLVEMFQMQLISKDQFGAAVADEYPDIKAIIGDEQGLIANIEVKLADVVRARSITDYGLPHKFMALDLAERYGMARLNSLEADGAPSEVLAAVSKWIEMVQTLQTEVEQARAARVSAGGGQPPAGGQQQTPLTNAAPMPTEEQAYV